MQTEGVYEVRVRVKTLADASKIIQLLDSSGYRDVAMGPPGAPLGRPFHPETFAKMGLLVRGRLNKTILRALYRLEAVDREHGVEVSRILEEMKKDSEVGEFVLCLPEGVLTRTVAMITPAVLAGKHEWVSYDPGQAPLRFWLTEKGIKEAKSA